MMFTTLWNIDMSRKISKKQKMPMMDADTIYIEPGIYKPIADIYVPHSNNYMATEDDKWMRDEHFLVSKVVETIGSQPPYQYYTIKKLGPSKHLLIKSYETDRWNAIGQLIEKMGF